MTARVLPLLALCLLAGCAADRLPPPEPEAAMEDAVAWEAVIAVVGDLMVHEEQLRAAYDPVSGEYDFTPSFAWVAADIAAADIAVGNLETVFGGERTAYSGYPRFNTPDSFAAALGEAGFDWLTTANNHCLDQGEDGLLRTREVLEQAGIGHTGTFSAQEEDRVAVVEVNGIRIVLAAFTYGVNDMPEAQTGLVNRLDRETADAVMRQARAQGADWVVALAHMGEEYEPEPGPAYREWAGYLHTGGADAVLAAHPHVLQPMEHARSTGQGRALTAYSLGNFLSSQQEPPRDTGILLKLRIAKTPTGRARLREVSILPVWTQHRDANGRYVARVIPIYDAVYDYEGANTLGLRRQDYTRLLEAHEEVTGLYLGRAVNRHDLRREYTIYSDAEADAAAAGSRPTAGPYEAGGAR